MKAARIIEKFGELRRLFMAANAAIKQGGFAGLDYNMAVLCIAAKRTGIRVTFTGPEHYEQKLQYWASKYSYIKRDYSGWNCRSEDELLSLAWEHYGLK